MSTPDDVSFKAQTRLRSSSHPSENGGNVNLGVTERPDQFGPEVTSRALRLGAITLKLQWVGGDSTRAEEAFKRINRQAAQIQPQELELIDGRKKPSVIAARAVLRQGKGYEYWAKFKEPARSEVVSVATELHDLLFEPELRYPIKSPDLPAGGTDYASTPLWMVYEFIKLCAGPTLADQDDDGSMTLQYLARARRVMRMIVSNDPSSVGLHPAVYFYSWTGKHQPVLFQVVASLMIEFDQHGKLDDFVAHRRVVESFLLDNRSLINQIVRKYGTKSSGMAHLRQFYLDVLKYAQDGLNPTDIVHALVADKASYDYLQPSESYGGDDKDDFSTSVKSGVVLRQLLASVLRCSECGGLVPSQAISVDHRTRVDDGGSANVANAQVMHPYCNTGFKERRIHRSRSAK